MRKICASYTVLAFAINVLPVHSQTRLPYEKAPYNDTVIQCGAVFALLADFYRGERETGKSNTYKEKFDKQLKTSEDEFVSVGRPKQEAQELYEERKAKLAAPIEGHTEEQTNFMVSLISFCDQKYPL